MPHPLTTLSKEILFEPVQHTYLHKKTQKKLLPVSSFIELFKNPFDPDGSITAKYAKKHNMQVAEVKKLWEDGKNEACDFGHAVHADIEKYIKTKKVTDGPNKKYIEAFSKIKFGGELLSEVILFNLDLGICGTSDILEITDNTINIFDIKTNKALKDKSYFQKPMKSPLDHILDLNYYHYTLQLSLYAYMLDLGGYWIEGLNLLHFNRTTETLDKYELEYKKKDIIAMFDAYNNNRIGTQDDWI